MEPIMQQPTVTIAQMQEAKLRGKIVDMLIRYEVPHRGMLVFTVELMRLIRQERKESSAEAFERLQQENGTFDLVQHCSRVLSDMFPEPPTAPPVSDAPQGETNV